MFRNGILLEEGLRQKSTNIQLMKFVAAMAVIYSHSFSLTGNKHGEELLWEVSKGSLSTGGLAVSFFFFISGLYVAKSLQRTQDGKKYFIARIKKIFPPLLAVVGVSAFVLGPVFTEYSMKDYFTDGNTYKYLLNGLLLPVHPLPGVFQNNPNGATVNGALWTLPVEFACYIALFIVYKLKLLEKKKIIFVFSAVIAGSAGLYILPDSFNILKSMALPGIAFFEGTLFYIYRDKIKLNKLTAAIFSAAVIVMCIAGFMDLAVVLFLPYIVSTFLLGTKQILPGISKVGNLAYSIYLLGFPVQQSLVACVGASMGVISNIMLSYIIVLPISVILYLSTEKPFMKKH